VDTVGWGRRIIGTVGMAWRAVGFTWHALVLSDASRV
jgi:hypothetical protein